MPLDGLRRHRGIYRHLAAELRSRPSHAYLFSGPKGIGKALVAKALVHGLACERAAGLDFCCAPERCPMREGAGAPPRAGRHAPGKAAHTRCECCPACVQVALGVHPDVIEVRRGEKRTDILIEQVREMIAQLGLRPSRMAMRVAIVDDAEALNIPAQNALLKTLEEPPGHAIIFVVTASERALLDTVRSRLRPVKFAPLSADDLAEILIAGHRVQEERAHAVARLARGSAARALALIHGEEPPLKEMLEALGCAASLDFAQAATLAQAHFGSREEACANFELIARTLEEILCYKFLETGFAGASPETQPLMARIANTLSVEALMSSVGAAVAAHAAVEAMANSRLQAEQFWMAVRQAAQGT